MLNANLQFVHRFIFIFLSVSKLPSVDNERYLLADKYQQQQDLKRKHSNYLKCLYFPTETDKTGKEFSFAHRRVLYSSRL